MHDNDDEEEAAFLRVLDLLEEHDEFASSSSDASHLDDEDEELEDEDDEQGDDTDASLEDHDPEMWQQQLTDWGALEDWELTAAMIELRQRRLPNHETVARILRDVADMYAESPTLVHVERPPFDMRLIVVGDLHGHFGDLMHILDENGDPSYGPGGTMYLFNGDFVDRGAWGPEVLLLIYCLKLRCPNAVHLNRGNHEDSQQNKQADNGFCDQHCNRAWKADGRVMYALCRRSFKQLPLMHVIGGQIGVMHGGLPLDRGVTLEEINRIDRKHRVPVNACNLLGYAKGQKVKASRMLETEEGDEVPEGTPGKMLRRVRRSMRAIVRFAGNSEVEVDVNGAPELEEDIDIRFDSKAAQIKQRQQRIFVALLWSDPVQLGKNGPSKRGVGCYFDEYVTREFLKLNGLRCIVRSHEKRQHGFCQEHICNDKGVLAATVFSASNYPSGAGEPMGNEASVVIINMPSEAVPLSLPLAVPSWREPYSHKSRWAGNKLRESIRGKLASAEADVSEELGQAQDSSRVRAIKKLRSMIYCARPALLTFWNRVDEDCTGYVSSFDWVNAMRACVVPDEEFPWEWIIKHIAHLDEDGNLNYSAFLGRFENTLLRRLAERWHGGAVTQLAPGVKTREQAEDAWKQIDRDGNGKLTYVELRPLLRTRQSDAQRKSKHIEFDAAADDDRVYSVLQNLDHDRSGFVDKEEFINAVVMANTRKSLIEDAATLPRYSSASGLLASTFASVSGAFSSATGPGDDRVSRCRASAAYRSRSSMNSTRFSSNLSGIAERRASSLLDRELKTAGDLAISQSWAAIQSALRALAAARCSVETVFEVLDADHDGDIDRNEFKEGLAQLVHDPALQQSMDQWETLLWKLVDEDGSGSVSHRELTSLLSIRDIVSL